MNDCHKPLILVVDDTAANLDLLVETLSPDYEVSVATAGEPALTAVAAHPPDLILLDILMPGMDGYEVCRRLKADPATRDIPVVFLTALTDAGREEEGLKLGAVDYLHKPANPALVRARVRNHLSLRRAQLDLMRQRDELQAANQQLRELEKLRDSLTHMIIHDMRSPLTTMSVGLGLVLQEAEGLSPKARNLLSQARASVRELDRMSNTLLDISRLEAGEMPLNRSHRELSAVLGRAIEAVRLQAETKRIRLEVSETTAGASMDEDLIYRVCVNLLVNAIKYTPAEGLIQARIAGETSQVRVEIADTGGGIPPEFHTRIFEKFAQVGPRPSGQRHSAGLGLTFCKLAVERHGGRIGVRSNLGQGSTFWFTLPVGG